VRLTERAVAPHIWSRHPPPPGGQGEHFDGDVLLDNASASTTIIVQGDDRFNAGVLTVAPDATNAGVIQLDSTSGYWGSVLAIQDMLDNTPTGQIVVAPGAGGVRWINGDIDNEGLVSVAAGADLEIDGATNAGPTCIQDGGSVQMQAEEESPLSKMPKNAQRKRFGIYYTPLAFTGLIVERTIDVLVKERFAALAKQHQVDPEARKDQDAK
jgi:hypothetical protein